MGAVRGGDIKECVIYDRIFDVKQGANVNFRVNGKTNETTLNGNGSNHTVQTLKAGGFDGLTISLDHTRKDLEYLQNANDSGEPGNCMFTLMNDVTYKGDLTLQGEIDASSADGQVDIAAMGAVFEQI